MTHDQEAQFTGRIPPYSEEAERGVLGAILMDAERVLMVADKKNFTDSAFYFNQHKKIFNLIRDMVETGDSIDLLTVHNKAKSLDALDDIGGLPYLQALIDGTPTTAHAEHYLLIMIEKQARRDLIKSGSDTVTDAYDEELSTIEAADRMSERAKNIKHGKREREVHRVDIIAAKADAQWESVRNGVDTGGVRTKYGTLGKVLGKYRKSMTTFAAQSAWGKSSHMLDESVSMGYHRIGDAREPTLCLSLEMSEADLGGRFVSNVGDVNAFSLDQHGGDAEDVKRIKYAQAELAKSDVYVEFPDAYAHDITDVIEYYVDEMGVTMVFVDYFQLIGIRGFRQGKVEMHNEVSKMFARHARGNYSLCMYAQLGREFERQGREPTRWDMKWCDALNDDSRQIMIGKYARDTGDRVVSVEKNNSGLCNEVCMNLNARRYSFDDVGLRPFGEDGKDLQAGKEQDMPI